MKLTSFFKRHDMGSYCKITKRLRKFELAKMQRWIFILNSVFKIQVGHLVTLKRHVYSIILSWHTYLCDWVLSMVKSNIIVAVKHHACWAHKINKLVNSNCKMTFICLHSYSLYLFRKFKRLSLISEIHKLVSKKYFVYWMFLILYMNSTYIPVELKKKNKENNTKRYSSPKCNNQVLKGYNCDLWQISVSDDFALVAFWLFTCHDIEENTVAIFCHFFF